MMHAATSGERQTPEEAKVAEDKESVAVGRSPFRCSPGRERSRRRSSTRRNVLPRPPCRRRCVLLLVALTTWIALRAATQIGRRLGKIGINVVIRIMGLLLAAVAVEISRAAS